MKLALLSDIHSNLQAFEACLDHARGQRATQFAFLGDTVGYGADPAAVMDRVMDLVAGGAWVVKGNHDELAVSPPAQPVTLGDYSAAWTHAQLKPVHLAFIQKLPLMVQKESVLLVHASAHEPQLWSYVTDVQSATLSLQVAAKMDGVRFIFGGHVHAQNLYYRDDNEVVNRIHPMEDVAMPLPSRGHLLATVGSVGQPRDGDVRAMYGMLDTKANQLTFYRVPYDHQAAADAVRKTELPEFFAGRLLLGR